MFVTAIRYMAKKPKPKMKPIELKTPPEQTQTITRVIFDILKEHGPLTIADTWEHVQARTAIKSGSWLLGAKRIVHPKTAKCRSFFVAGLHCVLCGLMCVSCHYKEVGLRGLSSKRHMKIVMRWMRERQKLRLICNHVGPHKQFLYTTWFTKPDIMPMQPRTSATKPTRPGIDDASRPK